MSVESQRLGNNILLFTFSAEESNGPIWSPARPPGYAVGVCSQQGKRPYQEDQYAIRQFVHTMAPPGKNASETHMFGLFDGHAGGRCSTHLSSNLANALVEEDSFVANLPLALKKSFYTVNEQFLKTAEKNKWHDGSTGNVAVIRDGKLTVANVGDCRAVLISNGRPLQMSNDHKPTNPDEQKRIASLGGAVVYCMGVARVNKVLAVSRAFGNRTLRQVIRPDAELMQRELVTGDDFLVMASDGLWDVLRNKDVCDVCYSSYLQRRPQAIAEELVNMALSRGSMDNVTCIVVNLTDYRPSGESAGEEMHFRRSMSLETGGLSRLASSGLHGESVVDTQHLVNSSDSDDGEEGHANSGGPLQYTVTTSVRLRPGTQSNNGASPVPGAMTTINNNNYPAHDIPSKQKSLGNINPRDLPSLGVDADPFGLKNARSPFVKAVSTNSMSSQENLHDSNPTASTSFGMGSFASLAQSEKNNPANGFLRPLTAIDAAPLPTSSNSNNGFKSLRGSTGGNHELTVSTVSPVLMGSSGNVNGAASQGNKLAQIRAMKGNSNSNFNMSGTMDTTSAVQQVRAMSRQGGIPRPTTQSQGHYQYGGYPTGGHNNNS